MKKLLCMAIACLMAAGTMSIDATYIASKDEVTNWTNENGTWYVLDDENNKRTGWYKDEKNCWFYLDYSTGAMKTGWAADGKDDKGNVRWYWLNPANGILQYGWQKIDGVQYYLYESGYEAGSMAIGEVEIDGVKYNFNSKGGLIGEAPAGGDKEETPSTPETPVDQPNKGEPRDSGYKKMDDLLDDILSEIITDGMTEREELKAIHDYVVLNTTYEQILGLGDYLGKRDDGKKHIPDYMSMNRGQKFYNYAYRTLSQGKGVCDDYVAAFGALADRLGYRTTTMNGYYDGGGHAVSLVWLDGEWLIVDVQADDWKDDGTVYDFGFLKTHDEYTHFEPAYDYFNWSSFETNLEQCAKYYFELEGGDYKFDSPEEIIEFYGGY